MARITPPLDLDQTLHPEFHRLVLQLGPLASMVDPVMLGRLVKARAEETSLSARIDREGLTVRGARGIVKNPLLPQLSRVRQQVARLEASTGVDLNARKRITGKVVRPSDDAVETDNAFLARLLLAGTEPAAEDMPRLKKLAAEGRKRRRR
ncbi:P27 family phage terminase small subunit [Ensifer sp. Root558]|uniref:P27 family phage terminase small subunit n=1 Tax=Ensifer sp. Root558 TaxID=1736558 RepID=UPI000713EE83|nr:P27 family phage terminase small subunit [Ensifer sp. Root558]KQZ45404.1 hypothetical protein ASD63_09535 [Ensifer sp. Root558]